MAGHVIAPRRHPEKGIIDLIDPGYVIHSIFP
jgi:hypothetical protein